MCPARVIATYSLTPALSRFLTAVRRKSWHNLPGQPALTQACFHVMTRRRFAPRQPCGSFRFAGDTGGQHHVAGAGAPAPLVCDRALSDREE